MGTTTLAASLAALAIVAAPARAQNVQSNLWVTNGIVNAIAVSGNTVYIGGAFTRLGPPIGGFVRVDGTTGAVLPPAYGVAGTITCSIPDGSGGHFVAGSFDVQGFSGWPIVHFDSSGHGVYLNSYSIDGTVYAMAIDPLNPGVLYLGGAFSHVDGAIRTNLAAFDLTTGYLTSWTPSTNGTVRTLTAYNGVIYIGGHFSQANSAARGNLAAVDASGALTAWDPEASSDVWTMALSVLPITHAITVWLGGQFISLQGQPRYSIGAVDGAGTPLDWSPNAGHIVKTMALGYSRNRVVAVYIGGTFDQIAGHSVPYLAELDASGAVVTGFAPSPDQEVDAIWLDGSTLYAGGEFTNMGGVSRQFAASVDASTGAVTSWNPSPNGFVTCLDASGGNVDLGGSFGSLGGVTRNHLAALDASTGLPTSWDPDVDGVVNALAVSNGMLFAAGAFSSVGGQTRGNGAAFDANGALTPWDPRANGGINALLPLGGSIYAGGAFFSVAGQPRGRLAQLDAITGDPWPAIPSSDGPVYALAIHDSIVYVGGMFQTFGGMARHGAAAFAVYYNNVMAWQPSVTGGPQGPPAVYCIAPLTSTLLIGGSFDAVFGSTRHGIAEVDYTLGSPTPWTASPYLPVRAFLPLGNTLFIGGDFSTFSPGFGGPLVAVDTPTMANLPWGSPIEGQVRCLAAGAGRLYAGGIWFGAGGWPHECLAGLSGGFAGVGEEPIERRPGALRLSANPSRGLVSFRFAIPERGPAKAGIYDLAGRRVREVYDGELPGGEQSLSWDGRDDAGRPARSGVYFVRVNGAGVQLEARLVHLR
ncbi:MAG TPA: FlgD immunoglobulin-like domain containing protein [Candidatus Sulfotelmatobacter sp.]|nr:FlgD immunoglobulin-like domain containing protein [Candidatus Sulfotelmatobacter sp.]